MKHTMFNTLGALALLLACGTVARAQHCSNPNLDAALNYGYGHPSGSGNTGDCDPHRYAGGEMRSVADYRDLTEYSHFCPDPWVGEAFWEVTKRPPTRSECYVPRYGNGHWTSYRDLVSKVQAYMSTPGAGPSGGGLNRALFSMGDHAIYIDVDGYVRNNTGQILDRNPRLNLFKTDAYGRRVPVPVKLDSIHHTPELISTSMVIHGTGTANVSQWIVLD